MKYLNQGEKTKLKNKTKEAHTMVVLAVTLKAEGQYETIHTNLIVAMNLQIEGLALFYHKLPRIYCL
jgi:hypothetical protein